ncbi:MAG: hypothetical protein HKL96_09125 [Phycisphaerales bacterium]|nr:hypothetical protein [Phycisphaerales bacterium]
MLTFHTETFPYTINPVARMEILRDGSLILRPWGAPGACFYVSSGDPTRWQLVQPKVPRRYGDKISLLDFRPARGAWGCWFFFCRRHGDSNPMRTRKAHWLASCDLQGNLRWVQLLGRWPHADFSTGSLGAGTMTANLVVTTTGGRRWRPEPPFPGRPYNHNMNNIFYLRFVTARRLIALTDRRHIRLICARVNSDSSMSIIWQRLLGANSGWRPMGVLGRRLWMWNTWSSNGKVEQWSLSTGKTLRAYSLTALAKKLKPILTPERIWPVTPELFGRRIVFMFPESGFAVTSPNAKGGLDLTAACKLAGASFALPDGAEKIAVFTATGHALIYSFAAKSLTPAVFTITGKPWVKPPEQFATGAQTKDCFRLAAGLPDALVGKLGAAALKKFGQNHEEQAVVWMTEQFRMAHKRLGIPIQSAKSVVTTTTAPGTGR